MDTNESSQPFGFNDNRLSHAYIAGGRLADTIAMAAVCSDFRQRPCMDCSHCSKSSRGIHPDIMTITRQPDRKDIVIDQIRSLKRDAIVVPNEAEKKVYIIDSAELMNVSAQNAFLQLLEDPPSHAVIILKTDNPNELLPTVRSRCIELKGMAIDEIADGAADEMADLFISALDDGNASLSAIMFKLEKLDRTQFIRFLETTRRLITLSIRDKAPKSMPGFIKKLSDAERTLVKADEYIDMNVSIGHVAGLICGSLMTDS